MVRDDEKSITKVSFGTIGLSVGSVLLVGGFLGYFNFIPNADNSLSALLLIYGFPISLIGTARRAAGGAGPCTLTTPPRPGFALKYAELQPLVCESYADAVALRETQATPILQQARSVAPSLRRSVAAGTPSQQIPERRKSSRF